MVTSRQKAKMPSYNSYQSQNIVSANNSFRREIDRPTTMTLNKSKYKQTTYNEDFPGLNENSYRKLEAMVDEKGLTGVNKENAMNYLYRQNVKYLVNDQILDDRAKEINEQAYQAAELNNPQAYAQLRMTEFSQALKKKYNLDAKSNDLDVFNTFVENLGEDGVNLAGQYLAGENKKLRYDAGLETFGEKAEDFGVGVLQSPGKRGYNLFGQLFDRAGKRVGDGVANMLSEEQKDKVRDRLDKNTIFKKDRINEYANLMDERETVGEDTFDGRRNTDITRPVLGEERATSNATKAGEVVGDIATGIAMTAPMGVALAPMYADATVLGAGVLGAGEGALGTAIGHLGSQGDLNISPMEAILGVGGGILGGELTRYLARMPKTQSDSIRKEAEGYINKSIKPTVKGKMNQADYQKFTDDALDVFNTMSKNKEILQYTDDAGNVIKGELPKNLRETSESLGNLKKLIYDQYNGIAKEAGDAGARVNLNKAFQNLDDLSRDIPQNLGNTNTRGIIDSYKNALLEYTDDMGRISIDDAQKVTQEYNNQLTNFFKNISNSSDDVSKSAITAKLNKWVKEAINESIDDALDNSIKNGSSKAAEYNQLKQLYGKIKTIEDEISKRALVEARKNSKGLSTTILDAMAGGEFTEALLSADPVSLGKAGAMKAISKYYNYINNPNTQLKKLFDLVDSINNPTNFQVAKNNVSNAIREGLGNISNEAGAVSPSVGAIVGSRNSNSF